MKTADCIIIGGGIIGLATGYNLLHRYPGKKVLILEKEDRLALHQSGHNSGVLHSGIYYKPGSVKATACRTGKQAMEAFCAAEGIGYEICGKVIVAVDESEIDRLNVLYERGQANGVKCRMIERAELVDLEPHASGVKAIHVSETGIVDYKQVCARLAARLEERGSEIITGAKVVGLNETSTEAIVESEAGDFSAPYVINCAGLYSDRVAALTGKSSSVKIVPFRGEYYKLKPEAEHLCRNLIYPVPDPQFPFLGVHFTRMMAGGVECGPNAVLAFAREGYAKADLNARDLLESITYRGFVKVARKHWRTGAGEMWRSLNKTAFVNALRRLMPEIKNDQLVAAPSGIRAQAIASDGAILDDFAFEERRRVISVINAPSPGATSSLSIGRLIVEKLAARF